MRKALTLFAALSIGLIVAVAQPSIVTVGNTTLDVRVVIQGTDETDGVDIPWEIQWGPDDHIWMTERYGRVSRLEPETGTRSTILDLTSDVYVAGEAGLLGLVLHPDFENTPQVFLAYTYTSSGTKERIVRYDYNSATNVLENPLTLIEGINGNTTHIGCRLAFLPDNTLLATTGDYQNLSSPQDESSLSGKVLRMNTDGSIPADNPFGASSYVYSIGHRNAQGLALAPNGNLYSSEHGAQTNDELNIITAGGNFGWPDVEGYCNESGELSDCASMTNYQDPVTIWFENSTIAPSDLVWYDHPAIPEWQGKLLMTVLKNKELREIEVDNADGTSVVSETSWFQNTFDRLRDICVAPDGRVFLATNGATWFNSNPFTHSIIELKNSAYSPTEVEEQEVVEVQLYPNPTNGLVTMVFDERLRNSNYTVSDQIGRVVARGIVQSGKMSVDFSHLSNGAYMISSTNGAVTSNQRLFLAN